MLKKFRVALFMGSLLITGLSAYADHKRATWTGTKGSKETIRIYVYTNGHLEDCNERMEYYKENLGRAKKLITGEVPCKEFTKAGTEVDIYYKDRVPTYRGSLKILRH